MIKIVKIQMSHNTKKKVSNLDHKSIKQKANKQQQASKRRRRIIKETQKSHIIHSIPNHNSH